MRYQSNLQSLLTDLSHAYALRNSATSPPKKPLNPDQALLTHAPNWPTLRRRGTRTPRTPPNSLSPLRRSLLNQRLTAITQMTSIRQRRENQPPEVDVQRPCHANRETLTKKKTKKKAAKTALRREQVNMPRWIWRWQHQQRRFPSETPETQSVTSGNDLNDGHELETWL